MAVEAVDIRGNLARVLHSIPDDPLWRSSYSLVEVVGDHSKGDTTTVKVGTPLVCPKRLSNLEVQSVVQLITGREARVGAEGMCDSGEDKSRYWRTYGITWP